MTDHDALLRAIVENPAEDTPRLIYADWLDENADALPNPAAVRARAAFMRDDIAASRLDGYDPARLRWELIEKPKRETEPWVKAVAPSYYLEQPPSLPFFRRGFPWSISTDPLVRDGPLEQFPIERVWLHRCPAHVVELLGRALWRARVRELRFQFDGGVPPLAALSRLSLPALDRLSFWDRALDAQSARELVRLPLFERLAALDVQRARVGPALVEEIARAGANGLRELHLIDCRVPPPALEALLGSAAARGLEALTCGGDRIAAAEKFQALARATNPPPIRALVMSEESPNEEGLEAFLACPLARRLRRLSLARCSLNRDRARMLAGGAFDELRVLYLNGNPIGNDGATALARSPRLAGLLVLDLSFAQVGDEGITAILESSLVDSLVLLDLSRSPASAEIKELLKARMGDRVRV